MKQSEHQIQKNVFKWAKLMRVQYPALNRMFAIPNGGERNKIVAAKLKAEGVKAGVPDIFLSVARRGKHGLYIEMKSAKGRVRPEQREWLSELADEGYQCNVCKSFDEAVTVIVDYLT